ncbi:hypothetical protein ETB97_010757 [Aspergillus alliaceus]|uniref:Uncharacterized protein n=1 Tax=Petromyces alliaceus TaxID=209559 RepID=A0A8H6ADT5_PETAA|nr:hypothetical protein ETB97_010757 [Aspergillus burnettii]
MPTRGLSACGGKSMEGNSTQFNAWQFSPFLVLIWNHDSSSRKEEPSTGDAGFVISNVTFIYLLATAVSRLASIAIEALMSSLSSSPNGNWHGEIDIDARGSSFSEREATLMRNYVDNMALWADITDSQRHFEIEVPLRALEDPVLRFAIFAFSSRHIDRQRSKDMSEALEYHNRCLQLLIPVLSGPRDSITDTVLAAVAILRQHEEMDCEDNQFHLTGTTRILNTVSSFESTGGLGEAAAWLCLREDIYISLTSQQPLRTDLHRFSNSDVFCRKDDFAWASRMVFLLAKVLKYAFDYNRTVNTALLEGIGEEIEDWNISA